MLAISASAPIFKGYLADVDCRWNVIASCVDDRTEMEQQGSVVPQPHFQYDQQTKSIVQLPDRVPLQIPKSRYDSVSTFLSQHVNFQSIYNDLDIPLDKEIQQRLLNEGVDELLARHVAHLFIRDPLVIYTELLNQDDEQVIDHFENIQSTNWQTMRFKPPPTLQPELGWRVEFRSMEVQVSDFENAAYAVFMVLVSRIILCLDLDLYVPISKVDANMQMAQGRDAVLTGQFWFRVNSVPDLKSAKEILESQLAEINEEVSQEGSPTNSSQSGCRSFGQRSRKGSMSSSSSYMNRSYHGQDLSLREWRQVSMDTIINGGSEFPGLVPLVRLYLDLLDMESQVRDQMHQYLELLSDRGAGRVCTWANYMRDYVLKHNQYQQDSVVSPKISYDLMREVQKYTEMDTFPKVKPVLH